jgi:hypothetical protein
MPSDGIVDLAPVVDRLMAKYDDATAPTSRTRAHLPAHCQCPACINGTIHASDCAVHNAPAYANGPCDCSEPVSVNLEARAIAMLDDEQLWATFYRWRTVLRGETAARSLREKLSVSEYVDAIFAKVPE